MSTPQSRFKERMLDPKNRRSKNVVVLPKDPVSPYDAAGWGSGAINAPAIPDLNSSVPIDELMDETRVSDNRRVNDSYHSIESVDPTRPSSFSGTIRYKKRRKRKVR